MYKTQVTEGAAEKTVSDSDDVGRSLHTIPVGLKDTLLKWQCI